MSIDEADELTNQFEAKWDNKQKHIFIDRMERKLNRKERQGRS
ncbi:MAG: hypothetical protein JWL89_578 [Candidatus Saccharibacteria bacterium]|jgi:hypothetical protein|nr:hypothetical protein [Candidatus Saccharibacteria bacterium]